MPSRSSADMTVPVARATTPDSAVLVDLEARHGAALFGFVRRLGLSEPQAQDCVQEVLLRLWAEIGRGNAIDDPKAWAYRAIYRLAMDEHRMRRRIEALAHRLVDRRDPIEREAPLTDHIAIWREIDRLPMRQRQVLYLRFRADLPFEDIATILDITASAARTHATLATRTIRSRLAEPDSGARRE